MYTLHLPSADRRGPSHVRHAITSPEQLASLLPRKLARNAEALHRAVIAQLGAGRESVTIQHSPYISASPAK